MRTNIISWAAKLIGAVSQFLMIRYLILSLGVDQYAVLAIINSFSVWLLLGDLGFGSTLQNLYTWGRTNEGAKHQLIRLLIRVQFALVVVGLPCVLLLSPPIGGFLFQSKSSTTVDYVFAFAVSNIIWMITATGSINYKLLYAEGKGYLSNLLPAFASFVSLILVSQLTTFAASPANLFYLAILFVSVPQMLASAWGLLLFLPGSNQTLLQPESYSSGKMRLRSISNQAFQFFLTSILIQASLNSDYIIMSQISTASEIAEYKIANSFFAFLYSLVYASLLILWPYCSTALVDGRYSLVLRKLRKTIYWGILSIIVFLVVLIWLRRPVSLLLTDGEIMINLNLLIAFACLYIARLIGDTFAVALASINKTKIFLAYLPIQLCMGWALSVWLGMWIGVVGIVIGLLVAFCLTHTWINAWYLYKLKRGSALCSA